MRTRYLIPLFATILGAACLPERSMIPDSPSGPGLHVLFIGNSLTYANNLPGILEALADSAHKPLLEARMVAKPDYSLEDHWGDGDALTAIKKGGWNVIVLQQGPSSVEENRQLLIKYAKFFSVPISQVGAKPALYMVWPTIDRTADFMRASESYRLAADTVHGLLFPVGDGWQATWRRDQTVPLYAFDGLHPSPEGSYLAALIMYAVLYGQSPVGLPSSVRLRDGDLIAVSEATAQTLQAAAAEVTANVAPLSAMVR